MHRLFAAAALSSAAVAALAGSTEAVPAATRPAPAVAACPEVRMPATDADTVYLETQVDQPAKPRRNNPEVRWPGGGDPRLGVNYESRVRQLNQGEVELRFVVDADGCADMRTVKVVASTDSAFTLAVTDVLPKWRFEPARKGGRKVAQVLQWRWVLYEKRGARLPIPGSTR